MHTPKIRRVCWVVSLSLALSAITTLAADDPFERWPHFSGVYPHTAGLSDSYSEAGIGAVVPWADRLWYVNYVAHKAGARVGLHEIMPDLTFRRRPESVVGTHAGRMIHRETNQLLIGPYVIDAQGNVRLFEKMARAERVTAITRHLTDPANKVYFQAMEGKMYEGDLRTLETTELFDLRKELGIGKAHFKGAYTSQGRYVAANNSYDGRDVRPSFGGAYQRGEGRLAEWDGNEWRIIHSTAFCDVTTAAGPDAVADDDSPLWSTGWDKRSVLLCVLAEGKWSTYRLPKGSSAYDHAWCTEWPRIRRAAPGRWLMDMHGLFYDFPHDFQPGKTSGLNPYAYHLRMTPDFCSWQGKLVLAADQSSSMGHRHRFGGQPQSNLWFGSLDEVADWGRPAGWGGVWLEDPIRAGVPSDPFLIQGFTRRTLHLIEGAGPDAAAGTGIPRCTGSFEIVELPRALAGLPYVTVDRGSMEKPAPGYSFTVDRHVTVYLAVHERGKPTVPEGWKDTGMKLTWTHGGPYTDTIYRREFRRGTVEIPGHDGHNELTHYGVPNMAFAQAAGDEEGEVKITGLPENLAGKVGTPPKTSSQSAAPPAADGPTTFTLEIDRNGTGEWSLFRKVVMPEEGYAWVELPDDEPVVWMRVTSDRDSVGSAMFVFGPRDDREPDGPQAAIFRAIPPAKEAKPQIQGGLLPLADKLWITTYTTDAQGRGRKGSGLWELDEKMNFTRRGESIDGVFANRKMVGGRLSIGPYLISDDGQVRTFEALAGGHVVASVRHPREQGKVCFLTVDGRLLEGDVSSLRVEQVADVPKELGLANKNLRFKGGHQSGGTIFVTAAGPDGKSGCLAEFDGKGWKLVDDRPHGEVADWASMSQTVVATGWDEASALLQIRAGGGWVTYRLPKADEALDRAAAGDQRGRIREVQTERILMDLGGIFYETTGLAHAWFVRPVATHGRVIGDFGSWRGLTVMTGGAADAEPDANFVRAGEDVGLWFGKTDDLWRLGRARGVGGPWKDTPVDSGRPSEPYLMTNFQEKRVELSHDAAEPVSFTLLVDPLGSRQVWKPYQTIEVPPGKTVTHEFPEAFSAHWVRVRCDAKCRATAWFVYD